MSRTPNFYLEKYNHKEHKYELLHPLVPNWNKTKMEYADLFPFNGCHDLFAILEGRDGYFHTEAVHGGLPHDAGEEMQKIYKDHCYESDYRTDDEGNPVIDSPDANYFNYADLLLYYKNHPKVRNYEYDPEDPDDEGKEFIESPIYGLIVRIKAFIEIMDWWSDADICPSDYRIIFWID